MKMELDHRFTASFKSFMSGLSELVQRETSPASNMSVAYEEGYKYIRVVLMSTANGITSKTAWGFIDKRSGDIFRSASWKAPCLNHTRGNIYDESNGLKHCLWTGPAYIWEIKESRTEEVEQNTAQGAD